MSIYQVIFFLSGLILLAYSRVMFSKHNAVFYYKGRKKGSNPIIEEWKDNIHIIANEAYRTVFGAIFMMSMAILWPQYEWMSLIYSLIITFLTSATASYHWQRWINLGVGLPAVDPNEKRSYELTFAGQSWIIPKFWWGARRKWISIIASICLLIFIILIQ